MSDDQLLAAFIVAMVLGGVGVLVWGEWWLNRKAAEDRALYDTLIDDQESP